MTRSTTIALLCMLTLAGSPAMANLVIETYDTGDPGNMLGRV